MVYNNLTSDKRSQAVGIAFAKIPVVTKIEEVLSTMDDSVLSRAHISALLRGKASLLTFRIHNR